MNPLEEWHLDTSRLGRRVLVFDRLDSTNAFALGHADDAANDGLVILADEQTAGRGQHGRTWTCPNGGGVLLSVLLFPPPALRRPAILTAWAAVSVCLLIQKTTGLEATIKWPNDVLIQDRKVCGILIEQTRGAVVGIGLNVNQPPEHFAAAGLPQAASLAIFAQHQYVCRDIARQLIVELDTEYERLCHGDVTALESQWTRRMGLVDQMVEVETTTQELRGRLCEQTFRGLLLELSDHATRLVTPESVKHVTLAAKNPVR